MIFDILKIMKKLLFIIYLTLFSSQGNARSYDWQLASTSLDGNFYFYLDITSIKKNKSGNYIYSVMTDMIQRKDSIIATWETDCVQLKKRMIYGEEYTMNMAKGKKTTYNIKQLKKIKLAAWENALPGSNNRRIVEAACKILDWKLISKGKGVELYADNKNITKNGQGNYLQWDLFNVSNSKISKLSNGSSITLQEINCHKLIIRDISKEYFNGKMGMGGTHLKYNIGEMPAKLSEWRNVDKKSVWGVHITSLCNIK
jgi:hypothetical protein